MSPGRLLLALGLAGCAVGEKAPGQDGAPGEDSATDSGTSTTLPPYECPDWSLTETQRFTEEELFPGAPTADRGGEQGPGIGLGDFDGDGDLDAILAVNNGHSLGFRNTDGVLAPDPTLALATGDALPTGNGVAVADLDGDGTEDVVFSAPAGHPDVVLYNDGTGRFTLVALPDSTGETLSPTLADLDGDGKLDILTGGFRMGVGEDDLALGVHLGDGTFLYLQGPDRTWIDARARLPDYTLYDLTFHIAVLDADLDGHPDLFVSNDHGIATGFPNYLLRNDGTGQFEENRDCGCETRMSGMGAAVADVDGNGAPDLYVTNWGKNQLLTNLGDGRFYDAADRAGVAVGPNGSDGISFAARFVDLDGNATEDLAVAYGLVSEAVADLVPEDQPDRLWLNDGEGRFTDVSDTTTFNDAGYGRAVVSGDLDRDGIPDLVLTGRMFLVVYKGAGGCAGPTVRLDAGPGNHAGIGAQVTVTTDTLRYTRWMWPGGTLSQSAAELYLGLRGASTAHLDVRWPDGRESTAEVGQDDRITLTP